MAGTLDETVTVYCVTDFKRHMPKVSGRIALMQALARRLQTPRGRFPFWPNYGTDICGLVLSKASPNVIASAAARECAKDERVESGGTRASATLTNGGRGVELLITVEDADGPFAFTMSVADAAAGLIQLQKESS